MIDKLCRYKNIFINEYSIILVHITVVAHQFSLEILTKLFSYLNGLETLFDFSYQSFTSKHSKQMSETMRQILHLIFALEPNIEVNVTQAFLLNSLFK